MKRIVVPPWRRRWLVAGAILITAVAAPALVGGMGAVGAIGRAGEERPARLAVDTAPPCEGVPERGAYCALE